MKSLTFPLLAVLLLQSCDTSSPEQSIHQKDLLKKTIDAVRTENGRALAGTVRSVEDNGKRPQDVAILEPVRELMNTRLSEKNQKDLSFDALINAYQKTDRYDSTDVKNLKYFHKLYSEHPEDTIARYYYQLSELKIEREIVHFAARQMGAVAGYF